MPHYSLLAMHRSSWLRFREKYQRSYCTDSSKEVLCGSKGSASGWQHIITKAILRHTGESELPVVKPNDDPDALASTWRLLTLNLEGYEVKQGILEPDTSNNTIFTQAKLYTVHFCSELYTFPFVMSYTHLTFVLSYRAYTLLFSSALSALHFRSE